MRYRECRVGNAIWKCGRTGKAGRAGGEGVRDMGVRETRECREGTRWMGRGTGGGGTGGSELYARTS